jgi:hypothetical protein
MSGEGTLATLAVASIVFMLIDFRISVASQSHLAFPLLSTVSSWFGGSIVLWAFLAVTWYWAIFGIVLGYALSYGIFGGSIFGRGWRLLLFVVPVLNVLVMILAIYLWAWRWPFSN